MTAAQLQLLIGLGRNPTSGEALRRAYPVYGRQCAMRAQDTVISNPTKRPRYQQGATSGSPAAALMLATTSTSVAPSSLTEAEWYMNSSRLLGRCSQVPVEYVDMVDVRTEVPESLDQQGLDRLKVGMVCV